jgi:hypothetical protein
MDDPMPPEDWFNADKVCFRELRKRRIAAVKAVLKKDLPQDMRAYWTGVLAFLTAWELEKRFLGLAEKPEVLKK